MPCLLSCASDAPRGFQADSYIYALVPHSYVMTIPIITNGFGGNRSTFHQDHVIEIHQSAFRRQRDYMNQLLKPGSKKPDFILPACANKLLPPTEKVEKEYVCLWPKPSDFATAMDVYWLTQSHKNASAIHRDVRAPIATAGARVGGGGGGGGSGPTKPEPGASFSSSSECLGRSSEEHYLKVFGAGVVHRVQALGPPDLQMPKDVAASWKTASCLSHSAHPPSPTASQQSQSQSPLGASLATSGSSWASTSRLSNVFLSGLCGRGKGQDRMGDIALTASHLATMYAAVHAPSKSPYALIIEDDVQFPFHVDFAQMLTKAPSGFAAVFLSSSEEGFTHRMWIRYLRDKVLFESEHRRLLDTWMMGAYIINKEVVRPIIDRIVKSLGGNDGGAVGGVGSVGGASGVDVSLDMKILAGLASPCVPAQCCGSLTGFKDQGECVLAPRGIKIESFLLQLFRENSYLSTMPLVMIGINGNISHFNSRHRYWATRDQGALRDQRVVVKHMASGENKLPPHVKPACNFDFEPTVTAAGASMGGDSDKKQQQRFQ